jgi:predicted GIY-YIG superfamily endonuclease
MKCVYLLQSQSAPDQRYLGITGDFQSRLSEHNADKSPHTKKFKPWQSVVVVRFQDNSRAEAFEKNLKSGSGHAFARRHFW